ncbi:uncharacterized protein LOC124352555 isoform X1 [Daphnia pulicaria]|uniref:uncharacterized protein LOC124312596 isoform X1 n=2 Tax=Daphnia pulicaria TaxID=35523 RepID=UPI001EEB4D02|nr:uncharacterized protein LOC124312596 isoform X1 [Daphnia pulicaria]XP_046633026.1 uncharacterized protein LOC124312597 isoform X1 [Daphnia pulicaria]XP_046657980.1 uncharacterized protein LOC124352495 isoform X1 [Daphnia pulicaria]XP_046658042.1 uncharacterized protein LOC124352555 isoform X1 [Daphnia pulicaria]
MGICMTTDTMTPDSVENDTEIQTISKSIPAKGVPLGIPIPFSKFNWRDESNNITTSAGDSSDPVFVIDASAVANLPTLNDSPIKKYYNELPKRIPLVIQRTIKESDIYNIPKINIIFVLDAEMQRSEIITNLKHLTEISGRLHHVDMMPIFLEVVSTIGSQDTDMIPPSKALEVFINRISSEIINVDAVLVTGHFSIRFNESAVLSF